MMKSGIELITQEREEQLSKHNRTVTHDVEYNDEFQLVDAASALLTDYHEEDKEFYCEIHGENPPIGWSQKSWLHMLQKPYKERLVIAGALIAAEYDRVQAMERLSAEEI